jgi:hypothetical protein
MRSRILSLTTEITSRREGRLQDHERPQEITYRTSRQRLQDSLRQKSHHAGLQHVTVRILIGSSEDTVGR